MLGYSKSLVGQTADALVATGKAGLCAVIVTSDGTNVATLDIYDNTTNSGTKVFTAVVPISQRSVMFTFVRAVKADIGLFADITGTGASYSVYYV